jgi:protein-S-isoprenylcysteine O-methyltransferase Ste14
MTINPDVWIGYAWMTLGAVWLFGIGFSKPTVRRIPSAARLLQSAILLLGFILVGTHWLGQGWLGMRMWPQSVTIREAGAALTTLGCLFAIWARVALGTNWSGRPTVKADHELIIKGPYALARHPIYTGLLVAAAGTALAGGELRCAVGMVLIVLGLALKMQSEERLMNETFPAAYPEYRRRVKALIPGVL